MSTTYSLTLISIFREVEKTTQFVEDIVSECNIGEDLKSRMMLALSEAATNAIVHGNREESNRKVFINATVTNDLIRMTIEDEGDGFNPDDVPDPVSEENLLKSGGRGLFFMEQFADIVAYSKGGRMVTLTFNR